MNYIDTSGIINGNSWFGPGCHNLERTLTIIVIVYRHVQVFGLTQYHQWLRICEFQ